MEDDLDVPDREFDLIARFQKLRLSIRTLHERMRQSLCKDGVQLQLVTQKDLLARDRSNASDPEDHKSTMEGMSDRSDGGYVGVMGGMSE